MQKGHHPSYNNNYHYIHINDNDNNGDNNDERILKNYTFLTTLEIQSDFNRRLNCIKLMMLVGCYRNETSLLDSFKSSAVTDILKGEATLAIVINNRQTY